MNPDIEQLKETRKLCLKIMNSFSDEALVKIPESYNNNILWNLGHLVVTQQLLHYKLSGLPLKISEEVKR